MKPIADTIKSVAPTGPNGETAEVGNPQPGTSPRLIEVVYRNLSVDDEVRKSVAKGACPVCFGAGMVRDPSVDAEIGAEFAKPCPKCEGTGRSESPEHLAAVAKRQTFESWTWSSSAPVLNSVDAACQRLQLWCLDHDPPWILMTGPNRTGKCLGQGTPVLRYDGTIVPVETVKEGDLLMGPDSRPRRVLSTTAGVGPLYRVVPRKGESYVVNDAHILSLRRPKYWSRKHGEAVVNISVVEFLAQGTNFRRLHHGWRTGVEFASQDVAIDPYFLGIWLGDGDSDRVSVTTPEAEVEVSLRQMAQDWGLHLVSYGTSGTATQWMLTAGKGQKNPLLTALRSYELIGSTREERRYLKHIPHVYMANLRSTRLALLAGLLDSDGHLRNGGFEITTKSGRLAGDILFLARSLGLAAYSRAAEKHCQTGGGGLYHRIQLSGDMSLVPTRVARKKAEPRRRNQDPLVTAITAKPIGDGEFFGFELEGDGLFLLGDFTVTHNSHLGNATVHWHHKAGKVASIEQVPEFLDALRAGYDDGSYAERFNQVKDAPVLVLDDIGKERQNDWTAEKLYQLLSRRYELPTIFTTNLTLDQIDPRFRSRAEDTSRCTVVQMRKQR